MIEATGLTKRLGGRTVVSDVSFRCEPGTVTGFLGPNGAGKTTTMRMLVGLSAPEAGSSAVLEQPYRALENPGRRVGVLLDASAQHPGRRGREALAVSAQMMGVDAGRVDELLDLVGLDKSAARKRVRQYSLGMRQRLGLAHALLGDPEVLILDEPANGLDPEGIRWMRGLLRDFADRGGTVLLSSHLLLEVEAVADRLLIIGNGRIVADGSREELLAGPACSSARPTPRSSRPRCAPPSSTTTRSTARSSSTPSAEAVGAAALRGAVILTHLGAGRGRRPGAAVLRPDRGARMTVSFPRLTLVELRKMVDTRAGFWLQLLVAVLTLAAVVVVCIVADADEATFQDLFTVAMTPGAVLLPIIGILLVSSEWSQRTALITFTLVPRRMRVMGAKVAAGLVLGADRAGALGADRRRGDARHRRRVEAGRGHPRPDRRAGPDRDGHRRRVRRAVPQLGAGDRALVRAPAGLGGAGLDPLPQRRRPSGWTPPAPPRR